MLAFRHAIRGLVRGNYDHDIPKVQTPTIARSRPKIWRRLSLTRLKQLLVVTRSNSTYVA